MIEKAKQITLIKLNDLNNFDDHCLEMFEISKLEDIIKN